MNKLIKCIVSCVILVGLMGSAYSYGKPPAQCPKVFDLKRAGLLYTEQDEDGYLTYQIAPYGTESMWVFGFDGIKAGSPQEALSMGYQALINLTGAPKPVFIPTENSWVCLYTNTMGYMSMAVTVPLGKFSKLAKEQDLQPN
jgi:hypothetical protein